MESVTCLFCGRLQRRVRYRGHDRLHAVPGEYTLVECAKCGFLYLHPRPDAEELRDHYPPEYGAFALARADSDRTFDRWLLHNDLNRRCETVLRCRAGGDLLDVGSGAGFFVAAMQSRAGWRARGLEPYAPSLPERDPELAGAVVDRGTLEDAPYPGASFDVVTLWEVVEHLPQPLQALRRIHALLRPGGALILSLPNRDSFDARIFGAHWCGLDIPRHLSVFSRAQIERAVVHAGFERPETFAVRGFLGAAHTELFSQLLSVHMWLEGDRSPAALKRLASRAFRGLVRTPAGVGGLFLLTLPYSIIARKLNRASQMVVVASRS